MLKALCTPVITLLCSLYILALVPMGDVPYLILIVIALLSLFEIVSVLDRKR